MSYDWVNYNWQHRIRKERDALMKIDDKRPTAVKALTIPGREIPIGTVFEGRVNSIYPGLWLRTYSGIVDLRNPHTTFNFTEADAPRRFGPLVSDYQVVHGRIVIERNG